MPSTTIRDRTLDQLSAAGVLPYVLTREPCDEGWIGSLSLDVLPALLGDCWSESNPTGRFERGRLYQYHREVGHDLIDFRSIRGSLGPGSLQLVVDQATGRYYADVDRFCVYQDVANFLGHGVGEVLAPSVANGARWLWRKLRRKKG